MSDLLLTLLVGVMQAGLYALVGLGLTLTFGVTHILNFAHGEFVTVGAFALVTLTAALSAPVAVPLALLLTVVVAALVYLVGFRFTIGNHLQGLAFSLGLMLFAENLFVEMFSTTPRTGPRIEGTFALFGGEQVAWSRVLVIAVSVLIVAAVAVLLKRSWVGLALRACGEDRFAAATLGLSARRVGLYAFVVAGLLAGTAGMCIASVAPVTPLTGADYLLTGFVVAIIGGLGSAEGVLVASLMLGLVEALSARYIDPSLTSVYAFGLMVVVLLVAPQGLFNRKEVRAG
ncbi:branched-chain amino acid ABC transporter permease [Thermobifida alba]|uniref:Branched-chain amino acid ABC transporter permease n=1 Tax=Thermobifida alba TaxID=53522 RepID=A0ABY4KZM9_THEAE|nr:branched-chain amino acid ABC transporter permease [Thermobifida alba]UPT20515.1 branched-chain amino acid ABC transporter permease [Thermobifida alba]